MILVQQVGPGVGRWQIQEIPAGRSSGDIPAYQTLASQDWIREVKRVRAGPGH
jgi:hypothetical protein